MKASEAIQVLNGLISKFGDQELVIPNNDENDWRFLTSISEIVPYDEDGYEVYEYNAGYFCIHTD